MHFSGAIQNMSVSLKDANKVRKRGTGKGERRKGNLKRGKWNGSLGPKAQR